MIFRWRGCRPTSVASTRRVWTHQSNWRLFSWAGSSKAFWNWVNTILSNSSPSSFTQCNENFKKIYGDGVLGNQLQLKTKLVVKSLQLQGVMKAYSVYRFLCVLSPRVGCQSDRWETSWIWRTESFIELLPFAKKFPINLSPCLTAISNTEFLASKKSPLLLSPVLNRFESLEHLLFQER